MNNSVCLTCHKDNSLEMAVKNLDRLLARTDLYEGKIPYFDWNVQLKCKYGMYCSDLKQTERKLTQILNKLEPKIMTIVTTKDTILYYPLLRNLQFYFPSVYKQVEKLYHSN